MCVVGKKGQIKYMRLTLKASRKIADDMSSCIRSATLQLHTTHSIKSLNAEQNDNARLKIDDF